MSTHPPGLDGLERRLRKPGHMHGRRHHCDGLLGDPSWTGHLDAHTTPHADSGFEHEVEQEIWAHVYVQLGAFVSGSSEVSKVNWSWLTAILPP